MKISEKRWVFLITIFENIDFWDSWNVWRNWKCIFVFFYVFWLIYWCFECFYEIQCHFLYMSIFKSIIWDFLYFFELFRISRTCFCLKTVLNGFPPRIPIPGVSKSLLPGGKKIRKKHMFDDLQWISWKIQKNPLLGGLKKLKINYMPRR